MENQFHFKSTIAQWIYDQYNKESIKKLINKHEYKSTSPPENLDFWVIGPIKGRDGLYLYGHPDNPKRGSVENRVISINPISLSTLFVKTDNGWFRVNINRAASSVAKRMDLLIRGGYTRVVLMHSDALFDIIND